MCLLDTNVLSEMRRVQAGRGDAGVERWSRSTETELLYLSDITILECQTGILLMERKDAVQAARLWDWLHGQILPAFAERILGVNTEIALRCAALHVPVTAPYSDSLIAATALVHGLTVVTRNVRDFEPMGVRVLNPWTSYADGE
jgi:predicted nucleic acid-binding protein